MMEKIYLDHNATTPLHPKVLEAMLPYFSGQYGNASSLHRFGQDARKAMETAREKIAAFIGARPDEICFTSGGTEADNFALKGIAVKAGGNRNHIITSAIEHHAVLNTCSYLEGKGYDVTYLPVNQYGMVDPQDVVKAITARTILVSIMFANNEVGTIQLVAEIGRIARGKGIPFHTDAVQALGKVPIDVIKQNIDLLSVSAHKLYGPKGMGALFIRAGTRIESLIKGGHHEHNKRAGTENVPGIVGFGKAVEVAAADLDAEARRLTGLRDRLYQGLRKNLDAVELNGHPDIRLPNTLNVSFGYIEGESIVLNLDLAGIAVSSGSACTSGASEPSHVLKAMGTDPLFAQGSIRFSLGRHTAREEIDTVVKETTKIVAKLRAMSPLYKEKKG